MRWSDVIFFFSSRRRHTRCALVTGVQTCALPISQSLRPAFAGIDAGDWVDPSGETRDVTVRLAPKARERVTDLARLPLVMPGPEGRPATLPLGQVATIDRKSVV